MGLTYLQETTDWSEAHANIPNHTYIFDDTKCVGYIKAGTRDEIMFSKPSANFSKARRTFRNVTKEYK